MSKELEALNKIQHDFGQLKGQELVNCYETIFNGLKRLESIDNSSPSEALEDLEKMVGLTYQVDDEWELLDGEFGLYHNKVKNYILKTQKQGKALEILKEKEIVDIKWLKASRNYKEYNSKMLDIYDLSSFLTEEEFELLRKVFVYE